MSLCGLTMSDQDLEKMIGLHLWQVVSEAHRTKHVWIRKKKSLETDSKVVYQELCLVV